MKRVLLVGLMLLLSAPALARNGAISLFVGTPPSFDCDQAVAAYGGTVTIHIYWIKGDGPDMGACAEFRVMKSSSGTVIQSPTWDAQFSSTVIGTLTGGVSACASGCVGVGMSYVHIGSFPVMNISDLDTAWVKIYPDPNALDPADGISITLCDLNQTVYPVDGGWFLINPIIGTLECNIAVNSTSWGAIKSLYR